MVVLESALAVSAPRATPPTLIMPTAAYWLVVLLAVTEVSPVVVIVLWSTLEIALALLAAVASVAFNATKPPVDPFEDA